MKRYYFHGDRCENDRTLYYSARDGLFVKNTHFYNLNKCGKPIFDSKAIDLFYGHFKSYERTYNAYTYDLFDKGYYRAQNTYNIFERYLNHMLIKIADAHSDDAN